MTTVRPGTGLDEDAAVAVWQAAQAERGRRSGGTRAQRVRARLRAPTALLLVAERDGDVVGVLLAELERAALVLALLAVRPDAQGSGVGTALVQGLLARYPKVVVWAEPDDVAFLTRQGFAPTGEEREGPLLRLASAP